MYVTKQASQIVTFLYPQKLMDSNHGTMQEVVLGNRGLQPSWIPGETRSVMKPNDGVHSNVQLNINQARKKRHWETDADVRLYCKLCQILAAVSSSLCKS